jgi:uncharacterized RDD family membrane protein YckC
MTWQGSGGTGGAGGGGSEPDDATRTDWSTVPGPGTSDPAVPPTAPAPPPGAPVPPPAAPAPPVAMGAPVAPWAPADASGGWGTTLPSGGRFAVPGAPGLVYAGALPRAAAFLLDRLLIGIVGGIISIPFSASTLATVNTSGTGAFDPAQLTARSGIASVILIALEAAYFILLWASGSRATLGMRAFGLQVGDVTTGNRLRLDQAGKRWLAYGSWLGFLGLTAQLAGVVGLVELIWTLVLLATTASSPTKQGLHDRFAGSAVVRSASAGNGAAIACLLVALVIPVLAVVSLVALFALGDQVSTILSTVGESV